MANCSVAPEKYHSCTSAHLMYANPVNWAIPVMMAALVQVLSNEYNYLKWAILELGNCRRCQKS